MKRYIIRGFINGDRKSLIDIGLPENCKIHRVWSIFDDKDILTAPLRHWYNVFLEDVMHDWDVYNGVFSFHGHSGEKGDKHDLLIEIKEEGD